MCATSVQRGIPHHFSRITAEFAAPPGPLFIRFRMTSDQLVSSPPYTGVAVDDVVIKR